MIGRPPSSPLFPHPPLSRPPGAPASGYPARRFKIDFRRRPAVAVGSTQAQGRKHMATNFTVNGKAASTDAPPDTPLLWVIRRSEEHTSELQSRSDLVCRLLL